MSSEAKNHNDGLLTRNTIALYLRTALMLVINLYTSRVILRVLGVDDFAIYSIIGNFVATFTIITSTLTLASQRFITVEIGRGTEADIRRTFSTTLSLHLIMAVLLVFLCEIIGFWYINEKMVIPVERIGAAQIVFHCSLAAMLFQFISIPYTSLIIAYEHMDAWAWISIAEVLLKLAGVLILPTLPNGFDYLVWYAVFIVIAAIVVRITYGIYCHLKFPHCSYQWSLDRKQTKEMSQFMGWNIFGFGADIVSKQCITLLINAFFALAVSAARGIAIQVESNVTNFARQIVIAFNPQITKSFAAGDKEYTVKLVRSGAKFGYFLFLFFALPLIIETPAILRLWLGNYPDWSVTFVRLSLISSLILSLTYTLDTTVLASGQIKWFQILSALTLMMTFPLTYLLYRLGLPAYCCYLSAIAMTTLMLIIKTVIATRTLDGYHLDFFRVIYTKCIPVTLLTFVPMVLLKRWVLPGSDYGIMFIDVFICLIWSAVMVFGLGLNPGERDILLKKLHLKH